MSWLRTLSKVMPTALVEWEQQRRELHRLGFTRDRLSRTGGVASTYRAVQECNYLLWPGALRRSPQPWALVDVGGNTGQFLRAALRLVTPGKVIVFEPLPDLATGLTRDLASTGVIVRPVAVGASHGTVRLNRTANSVFSSVLTPKKAIDQHYGTVSTVATVVDVEQVSLDNELDNVPRIGLLKLDVQGYEPEVLVGAADTLSRTDAVLIEINYIDHYEGEQRFESLHETLSRSGFRLRGVSRPNCGSGGTPLWADAVYVRRGGPSDE